MKFLILNVDAKPVDGAERYLPEPAMGNMKPGTEDYKAKWQEKRNKQLQDLQSHSFLSEPLRIAFAIVECDGAGFDIKVNEPGVGSIKDFFKLVKPHAEIQVISGPHPTTHSRILINSAIRTGMEVPQWLVSRRRLNPWQFIATSAEGEYPMSWVGLGHKPAGPVQDTFDLLKALGPAILAPTTLKE